MGVDLAGILGDEQADRGGLVRGEGSGPVGERSAEGGIAPSQKKRSFRLKWRVLLNSERHFLKILGDNLHYRPPLQILGDSSSLSARDLLYAHGTT